jgi:hypothetical protein
MVHEYGKMENTDIFKLTPKGTDMNTWVKI